MLARASIVSLDVNSFYSFDTLMSSLILYSAKNVKISRNKHGVFVPNTAKENWYPLRVTRTKQQYNLFFLSSFVQTPDA